MSLRRDQKSPREDREPRGWVLHALRVFSWLPRVEVLLGLVLGVLLLVVIVVSLIQGSDPTPG